MVKSLFFATILLTACTGKSNEGMAIDTQVAIAPVRVATMEDWNASLGETLVEKSVEDKGNGVTSFLACFKSEGRVECATNFGRRDSFKKSRFFSAGLRASLDSLITAPYLQSFIALPDGELPVVVLRPVFTGDSWIFMNKVAVMVDGQVVLDEDLDSLRVKRDTGLDYVDESYQFELEKNQIEALRKITKESKVIIRITGDSGYTTVDKTDVDFFKQDIGNLLQIYDHLTATLKGHIPPVPSAPTPHPAPARLPGD